MHRRAAVGEGEDPGEVHEGSHPCAGVPKRYVPLSCSLEWRPSGGLQGVLYLGNKDADLQDGKLARFQYADACEHQCKRNSKHGQGCNHETTKDE